MSSKFFSTIFISSDHSLTFLISSKLLKANLSSSVYQKAFTIREKLFYTKKKQKALHAESFCTEIVLDSDTDAFTQRIF